MGNTAARRTVEQLRRQLQQWEQERRLVCRSGWLPGVEESGLPAERIGTGVESWDRLMPEGGFRRGTLVEFFGAGGSGVGTVALWVARCALQQVPGVLVVVERRQRFYPPAAAVWGIPLDRCIWVQVPDKRLQAWTIDQALRSPAVAAVWSWVERLEEQWGRRWQLAAESAGTLGLLLRPSTERGRRSWADMQWMVVPECTQALRGDSTGNRQPVAGETLRQVRLTLVRSRLGPAGGSCRLVLDDFRGLVAAAGQEETRHGASGLSVVAALAYPAAVRSASLVGRRTSGAVCS
ncbi:MAG: hypothetical protein KatS3mg109_0698 [Pirellulaceae bacterium]|nr:MAG: hypothetical protein KatS3mg109_0698 [Pirellulaceae bacterium]GIW95333.1 MAG: hypothetical protein KatS3mg110_3374 [Pirellulaceae bacterium]